MFKLSFHNQLEHSFAGYSVAKFGAIDAMSYKFVVDKLLKILQGNKNPENSALMGLDHRRNIGKYFLIWLLELVRKMKARSLFFQKTAFPEQTRPLSSSKQAYFISIRPYFDPNEKKMNALTLKRKRSNWNTYCCSFSGFQASKHVVCKHFKSLQKKGKLFCGIGYV